MHFQRKSSVTGCRAAGSFCRLWSKPIERIQCIQCIECKDDPILGPLSPWAFDNIPVCPRASVSLLVITHPSSISTYPAGGDKLPNISSPALRIHPRVKLEEIDVNFCNLCLAFSLSPKTQGALCRIAARVA